VSISTADNQTPETYSKETDRQTI